MLKVLNRFPATQFLFLLLLCFIAGSLSSLAMAPTNAWLALFVGLSALYVLLVHSKTKVSAFLRGWAFGFGYFLFGLSWIGNALLVEGNPYAWAWPLAVSGLPFLLAFFPALSCFLSWKFFNLKAIPGYLGFVASLALFEWLRGHIFTGFPWNLYGYTWADSLPVIQVVSLANVYFLTFLTILWGAMAGFIWIGRNSLIGKSLLLGAAITSFGLCYGFGVWRLNAQALEYHEDVQIRIVQPNIPQEDKWDRTKMTEHFFSHIRLSYPEDNSQTTTYIIWPETAMSYRYAQDKTSMNILSQALSSYAGKAYVFTGLLVRDFDNKTYANSLVMIDESGNISNTYSKYHLVPFGEYIPFQKWIPIEPVVRFSGFVKGEGLKTLQTPEGLKYSPLICYEVIFPGATTAKERPDFIVNVTNDAWYGFSAGPYQHFTQAKFRAIEEGIPVIRSANTGISALIDPLGRLLQPTELFMEKVSNYRLPKKIEVFRKNLYHIENMIFIGMSLLFFAYAYIQRHRETN